MTGDLRAGADPRIEGRTAQRPPLRRRILSPLGLRLAVAFVVVAVAALAVLVGLLLSATSSEVSRLVERQHEADAQSAATAAADSYAERDSWDGVDLTAAAAIAARGQATLVVSDVEGRVVAAATDQAAQMMAEMHGVEVVDVPRSHPVSATVFGRDGTPVGAVHLAYPIGGAPTAEQQVRTSLSRVVLAGALLSAALAIAVAVFVARQVTRPITALTEAARKLETGRRDVHVDLGRQPGELGDLAAAFDRMSAAVTREDQLRRELVADVAHEVRTPLTILRATTEGLVDGVIAPDEATLQSLHEEVLRLSGLVNDLETLAAADASGLTLQLDSIDLAQVAAAAAEMVSPAATGSGLRLDVDLRPAPCRADARRMHQVAVSLLANAVRYTPAGGRVTVTTTSDSDAAVLEVADTGPGIAAGDLPRIFDRFYRGSAAQGQPGSGIGLAVARELVAAHRGTIRAASSAGGATFTVRIPHG